MRAHEGELEPVSISPIRTHVCPSLPPVFIKWLACGKALQEKLVSFITEMCSHLAQDPGQLGRTSGVGGAADLGACTCQPDRSEVSDDEGAATVSGTLH